MSITLSKKAIILVTVPLIFEVGFVVGLSWLLHGVQYERERENHAREISTHVNGALVSLLDRFSSCILYHVSDSDAFRQRFANSRAKIQSELKTLHEIVAPYPEEKSRIDELSDKFVGCGEDLQRAQGQLELGDKMQAAKMWIKADRQIESLLAAIDNIVVLQQKDIERRRLNQKNMLAVVDWVLPLAVAFNILLAFALVFYFNRSTTRRLETLIDNTVRLAIAKPLNERIGGDDEFAHLDGTFREMAAALAESRRKEQAVVENAADVICTIDREGAFAAVNPAVEALWGYSEDQLVGEPINRVVFAEDFKATVQAIADIVASRQKEGSFENRIVRADGRVVDFAWSAHWSAEDRALFCVARDITERKEVDRMKRDFVAMISHDLRTPLTSIQMVLSLLDAEAYGQLSDNGHEKLAAAEANVDRLIGLVNGLLDLEKMESGKLELLCEPCPVASIVKAAIGAVSGFAEQQGVRLEGPSSSTLCDRHGDLIVYADKDRIVQVVINLISNAVKFAPNGSTVALLAERDKGFARLAIVDQGRGIPADMLEAVFDRFQQVEVGDARVKGGSGLGLAICKAIVERHGGRIGVESVEGRGSTFWFTLPENVV
ncbi:MAG: cell wall metabolism sensor histidine kinase WalK [Cyanobacteria bacterium REEB67]|nr:cell wall metabolism sensor histidine kinase WalK [Cyanobacteria bacterium REEB67]